MRDALKRHRVPAHMLIMEITESTAMDDIEASMKVFDMLDAIGVRLSIEDFGTGYSSLSDLRRLPARQLNCDELQGFLFARPMPEQACWPGWCRTTWACPWPATLFWRLKPLQATGMIWSFSPPESKTALQPA